MRRRFALIVSLMAIPLAGIARGQELPQADEVQPQMYATGFEFSEGPAFDSAGNLYVVNYRGIGNIGRITPDGEASVLCVLDELAPMEERRSQANGLKVDGEGRLIAADAGGGRLLRISADGKQVEVLADRCEGARFNAINDVALDTRGNIFFTDPGGSSADSPIGVVYRYDISTAKVSAVASGLAFPNGLAVTPDQRHLCVSESQRYRLLIYDLDGPNVMNQRALVDFPREDEGPIRGGLFSPDGLIFDEHGRLYVAMWTGGFINVLDVPSGRILRQYDAGGGKVTNCHFHEDYLYTTVASKEAVFRLKLGVRGFDYNRP